MLFVSPHRHRTSMRPPSTIRPIRMLGAAGWVVLLGGTLGIHGARDDRGIAALSCDVAPPLVPQRPIPDPKAELIRARAQLADGRLFLAQGAYDKAWNRCFQAAGNATMRALALLCMGQAELGRTRYDEAIQVAQRALKEKDPPRLDLFLLIARAHELSRHCGHAIPFYQKALRIDPGNADAIAGMKRCT